MLEIYGIEKNEDIVEYFSTYYFLRIDIKFKNYLISINSVEPKDEYKSLRRKIDAYTDSNGKITHIPIGVEQQKANYNVVVEVKTGVVKFADDEKRKNEKNCTIFGRIYKRMGTVGLSKSKKTMDINH